MTDKKKITLIYTGVAAICVVILGMSWFLTTLRKERRNQSDPIVDAGKEQVLEFNVLEKDIELERQDGSKVKISDLDDKVWLAVQFYVSCPMCAERNAAHLLKIYREFQDEPNFQVVCLSIDPEEDTPEKQQEIRELLDVDPANWWFLKTERTALWDYMRNEMLFNDIRERTEPIEAAAKGKWAHDLSIQVYRGDTMVKRWDAAYDFEVLRDEVKKALVDLNK
ncbi:MAG: SCO family protein [Akkermansiaceae bacterium]|jgi:cytochrome oxidase Cu insertion factor (SCO1/SenC/PrrC family)